jgi:uncharacterized protein YkwD
MEHERAWLNVPDSCLNLVDQSFKDFGIGWQWISDELSVQSSG